MKLVSVAEMQQIEREADAGGLPYAQMMENAGRGLAEVVAETYHYLQHRKVLGLVGSGNNGGDTLVALALLAEQGWESTAYLVRPRPEDDPLVARFDKAGGKLVTTSDDQPGKGYPLLSELVAENAVILDGVLGTGFHLPLKPEVGDVLAAAKAAVEEMEYKPAVVAVDCPSGVDLDSGEAAPEAIPASLTVTMAAVKAGLLKFPAYTLVGELEVVGIGDLEGFESWQKIQRRVVSDTFVRDALPPRPLDAHKGTFGTALVVAGSTNYTGAALLAGEAAFRIGAGLVTLAVPASLHDTLAGHFLEATWLLLPHDMGVVDRSAADIILENLERVTAVLVGPGFGTEETTTDFIARLLGARVPARHGRIGFSHPEGAGAKQKASATLPPLVIDADGLKLLARIPDWPSRLPAPAVLTPHPGEMAVLTGLSKDEIQADRVGTAERFAREWGHVVLLKGAFTVAASPDGQTFVVPVATPALARAGTGDVLAGMVVGLRAQGLDAFRAAAVGAWLHAQAGLRAAETVGHPAAVLAGDVLFEIAGVLSGLAG